MKEPPVLRIKDGDDEVGIYAEDDIISIVWYDHQGDVGEFPARLAGRIGEELHAAAMRGDL